MRLLECSDGAFKLTKDLAGDIPSYAILSHTWGPDTEEVTFGDLVDGTGKNKTGYEKIRFCAAQARRNGLRYFWVDTCCIDKSNNNELSTAINSMFRWYQNATRCYVYLSDIEGDGPFELAWEPAFRASKWFTRGWTLQELLAPVSVEFFTKEGRRLGDKRSLEKQIHEITGIAIAALRTRDLCQFDVDERFKWAETRQTTQEEDWAYCLLGIFGIFMPLIYGEGKAHAVRRLRKEIADTVGRSDVIVAHNTTLPIRGQHRHSIWKDGFNHGFYLEKVPLINRFVGRHEYITDMELCLLPNPKQSRRKVFIVCGLGGMGKTQLAIEFARRHQTTFSSIFFVDGSSKDALLRSFIRVFRRVAISDIGGAKSQSETDSVENSTSDEITAKALEWFSLEGNDRWLLIYDNVDLESTDPGGFVLDTFFPAKDCGSIIVTSRLACLPVAATVKRLGELDAMQSIELLTWTSTTESATKATTYPGSRADTKAAAKLNLIEDLGGLPLAISQAGKLMKSLGIEAEEYLELYKSSKRKVIDMLLPEAMPNDPERASIRTTWITSVNILKQRMVDEPETGPHRCAYRLLHLFAYFNPTDLDYELLRLGKLVNNPPAWVSKIFESKLDFYTTVKILLDLSLIDKTNNSGVYSMHRVVFDWLCTYEAHETEAELLNVAAAAIAWACPVTYQPLDWAESQQRLVVHANVLCPRVLGRGPLLRPVWHDQLNKMDLELAAELWECDTGSLSYAQVYHPAGDIARLLSVGGRPREALALIEDSITHALESHPEQSVSYYALLYEKASILHGLSRSSEANKIQLEAREGFCRLQNPYWIAAVQIQQAGQHVDPEEFIKLSQNALATARAAGLCIFYCPAWIAFENIDRCLQWEVCDLHRRRVHLETIKEEAETRFYDIPGAQKALCNLAFVYSESGLKGEAEMLYLKLHDWRVRRHGRDAIECISRVQDLACFYFNQRRAESIKYDSELLRLAELHHGSASRDAETAHRWLGESYEIHGQLAMARLQFERAWSIHQSTKGQLETEGLVIDGLIRVCGALGDKEAMEMYQTLRSASAARPPKMAATTASSLLNP